MILLDFVVLLVVLVSVVFGAAFAFRAFQNLPPPKDQTPAATRSIVVPMLLVGLLAMVLLVMALIAIIVVVTSTKH